MTQPTPPGPKERGQPYLGTSNAGAGAGARKDTACFQGCVEVEGVRESKCGVRREKIVWAPPAGLRIAVVWDP